MAKQVYSGFLMKNGIFGAFSTARTLNFTDLLGRSRGGKHRGCQGLSFLPQKNLPSTIELSDKNAINTHLSRSVSITHPFTPTALPTLDLYKNIALHQGQNTVFCFCFDTESREKEREEISNSQMEVGHFVFGIFGNATALFLFLSPMITFRRVIRKKSTEDFSGVPYNMTLLNCLLSAWYGLPFVSPNNMLVWTINGTGALIEAIYVLIFLIYAPKKTKARMFGLLALVSSVFAAVALISMLALHSHARKLFCGFAATIFSICMYASPLSVMRLVIRTKSVEFMPFFLSLFVFLCGTSWFIYGLLGHDLFITVPNGCGSALGAVQLILYVIYRSNKGENAAAASKGEAIEMGGVNPLQASGQHASNEQV